MKESVVKKTLKRKPLHAELNMDSIWEWFNDAYEECSEVAYAAEDYDALIDALDGDEDEAYEFRMAFSDLQSQFEMFYEALNEAWVPKCFDLLFAVSASGTDSMFYQEELTMDIIRMDRYDLSYEQEKGREILKRMTKDELLDATRQCLTIATSYMSLRARYDALRGTMDVVRGKNGAILRAVRRIDELYNAAWEKYGETSLIWRDSNSEQERIWFEFDRTIKFLPQEAFIA